MSVHREGVEPNSVDGPDHHRDHIEHYRMLMKQFLSAYESFSPSFVGPFSLIIVPPRFPMCYADPECFDSSQCPRMLSIVQVNNARLSSQ